MSSDKNSTDKKHIDFVWKAFIKGKRWAFTKIYEDSYPDLYRFGLKFLNNPDRVKDLIHDVFFKLWQNKKNLSNSPGFNMKAYLLKSLRGTILNYIRDEKKIVELNEGFDLVSSTENEFLTKEDKKVNLKKLKEEIQKLTAKQKEAIYLHYIFRLSYNEVSEIMNINTQSVRNLVCEGIQKLRDIKDDLSQ